MRAKNGDKDREERARILPPPLRLDVANAQAWQGEQLLKLTPKAFAVLRYLSEHLGQLVTKDELMGAVWTDTVVTDGALAACIRELRKALQDDAQSPQYIETVHRRGYRFIAPLSATPPVASRQYSGGSSQEKNQKAKSKAQKAKIALISPIPNSQPLAPTLVGREAELVQLHTYWEKAVSGERQLVFVTGEPGIGKTSVVQAFLQSLASDDKREQVRKVRTLDPRP